MVCTILFVPFGSVSPVSLVVVVLVRWQYLPYHRKRAWYSFKFSLRANASISSLISSFLGSGGVGQKFRPL